MFSISSNWVVKFDYAVIKQLYKATGKKVAIMCKEVINGEKRILRTGTTLKILMEFVMFISPRILRLVGKDITINKSCSHCEQCIKNCPARNIYIKKGKIKFMLACNSCMRCVYSCPQKAIRFRLLSFFPVSDHYNIKEILKQPRDASESVGKSVPPFFNDYIQDDAL